MDIFMDNSWLHVWEYKKTRSAFLFKRSLEYNVRSLVLAIHLPHTYTNIFNVQLLSLA